MTNIIFKWKLFENKILYMWLLLKMKISVYFILTRFMNAKFYDGAVYFRELRAGK